MNLRVKRIGAIRHSPILPATRGWLGGQNPTRPHRTGLKTNDSDEKTEIEGLPNGGRPPKIWTWDMESGGRFASINQSWLGPTWLSPEA
jgi:hypothetical protein